MRDAAAAALVRVSLLPLLAIVVGITAAAAWNRVGSQGCVANELMPSGKKSALVRLHQQLGFLANAFTHWAAVAWAGPGADFGETPGCCCIMEWSRLGRHCQSKEEEYEPRLKLHVSSTKTEEKKERKAGACCGKKKMMKAKLQGRKGKRVRGDITRTRTRRSLPSLLEKGKRRI